MILYAILGVLFVGSLVILITHSYRPNTARSWLIAMITALLAWIASFGLRLYLPSTGNLLIWFPDTIFEEGLGFVVDYLNWPYMVAVLGICVAALLTDTTRADPGINPYSWVQTVSITGLNLFAILAANPLTMAIAWQGQPFAGFDVMQPNASFIFLIAAGLRLGVFPLNLPFLDSPELRQSAGTLFRLTPAASALVLIAHLPAGLLIFNQVLLNIAQVLTLIAAFYSSLMWLTRKTSYEGRLYWMVTLSAFAIQSALNGHPEASRVWGLGLLLSGSLLFLFNPPIRRIRFLPLLGLLGFIGLPYTLAASGWEGLLPDTFGFTSAILITTHAFLVLGYIRYIIAADSTVTGLEKYARITFPLGLVTLIQTILLLGLIGWPGVLLIGNLSGSLGSLALVLIGLFVGWRIGFHTETEALTQKVPFYRLLSIVFDFLRKALSLSWLSGLVRRFFISLSGLFGFFSQILEGDGGILWSMVFLLVLSILFLAPGAR